MVVVVWWWWCGVVQCADMKFGQVVSRPFAWIETFFILIPTLLPLLLVRVRGAPGPLLLLLLLLPPSSPAPAPPAQVFTAVVRHIDWDIVRCLVIAGPGFAKDQFREYLDRGR